MRFKHFLLNESRAYLGQRVGDILAAVQELRSDARSMGSRDLTRYSDRVVDQIRLILRSNWPREEKPNLLQLQKIAVAIKKAIDEKGDLPGTISGAASALEKLSGGLGVPVNTLASTDRAPQPDDRGTDLPTGTSAPKAKPAAPAGPPPPTPEPAPLAGDPRPMNVD